MKRLLRAMWFALLPLIAVFVILAAMYGITCIFESLGLDKGIYVPLTVFISAYVLGVVVFYKD